jgi:hypothetical protein
MLQHPAASSTQQQQELASGNFQRQLLKPPSAPLHLFLSVMFDLTKQLWSADIYHIKERALATQLSAGLVKVRGHSNRQT